MRQLREKAEQPEHNEEPFQKLGAGDGGVSGGVQSSSKPGNKEGIGLARWFGMVFPATVPAIFQVPRGSTAGVVRICARGGWLEIPCGFLPGQTRPTALVDCHLR